MLKQLIIFLLLFISTILVYPQSTQDKAKAYFIEAKSSFESGSYSKAIERLEATEKLLGSTNPVILNLKVKTYFALKEYTKAQQSLDEFSRKSKNADADLKNETLSYIIKIEDGLQQEIDRKERVRLADNKRNAIARAEDELKEDFKKKHKEKYGNSDRRVFYKKDDLYGVVDKNLNIKIPFKYTRIKKLSSKIYLVSVGSSKAEGLVDIEKGIEILSTNYNISDFKNGYATIVNRKGLEGMINLQGRVIIPMKYYRVSHFSEGLARVKIEYPVKYNAASEGFINQEGDIVIPIQRKAFGNCIEGRISFVTFGPKGRHGFMDKTGRIVIKNIYYSVEDFEGGKAKVKRKGKKWHYIDKSGNKVK